MPAEQINDLLRANYEESLLARGVADRHAIIKTTRAALSDKPELMVLLADEALADRLDLIARGNRAKTLASTIGLEPDLFGDSLLASYKVKRNGSSLEVRIDHLMELEAKGLVDKRSRQIENDIRHRDELEALLARCRPCWRDHPGMTVGQCLRFLSARDEQTKNAG